MKTNRSRKSTFKENKNASRIPKRNTNETRLKNEHVKHGAMFKNDSKTKPAQRRTISLKLDALSKQQNKTCMNNENKPRHVVRNIIRCATFKTKTRTKRTSTSVLNPNKRTGLTLCLRRENLIRFLSKRLSRNKPQGKMIILSKRLRPKVHLKPEVD